MSRQEIFNTIIGILVSKFQVSPTVITEHSRFREDLGLDSLHLVEFSQQIEVELGIDLSDKEMGQKATICSLLNLLESKLAKSPVST